MCDEGMDSLWVIMCTKDCLTARLCNENLLFSYDVTLTGFYGAKDDLCSLLFRCLAYVYCIFISDMY